MKRRRRIKRPPPIEAPRMMARWDCLLAGGGGAFTNSAEEKQGVSELCGVLRGSHG